MMFLNRGVNWNQYRDMKTIINSNEDLIVLNLHKVESSKYINLVIKVVHSIILCSTFFFKLNSRLYVIKI